MVAVISTWSGPELPTGTLTFLFTDVEGRTRPGEQQLQAIHRVEEVVMGREAFVDTWELAGSERRDSQGQPAGEAQAA